LLLNDVVARGARHALVREARAEAGRGKAGGHGGVGFLVTLDATASRHGEGAGEPGRQDAPGHRLERRRPEGTSSEHVTERAHTGHGKQAQSSVMFVRTL